MSTRKVRKRRKKKIGMGLYQSPSFENVKYCLITLGSLSKAYSWCTLNCTLLLQRALTGSPEVTHLTYLLQGGDPTLKGWLSHSCSFFLQLQAMQPPSALDMNGFGERFPQSGLNSGSRSLMSSPIPHRRSFLWSGRTMSGSSPM